MPHFPLPRSSKRRGLARPAAWHTSAAEDAGLWDGQKSYPVYPVADVAASIEWYGRVFGFEVES